MKQKRTLAFVTLLFLYIIRAFAYSGVLYTADHDLPNSLVNKIVQSSDGMIWIATENGLSMFNGSSFRTYYHKDGDERSLVSNFVRSLCADNQGHLLVGTTKGVQAYCHATDDFTPVILDERVGIRDLGNVSDIYKVADNKFLVTGYYTFFLSFDKKGNPQISACSATGKELRPNHCIMDKHGCIWLTCLMDGLYRIDKNGKMSKVLDDKGRDCQFQTIAQGPDGRIYGSDINGGLYVNTGHSSFSLIEGTESLPCIRDIRTVPGTNTLCIASDGGGICFYDCKQRRLAPGIIDDPFIDLSSQKVHSLYFSEDGDLWMGIYQKGVYVNVVNAPRFNYIGYRSTRFNSIGNKCVTSLLQTHDGNIWVSTDNGGIYGVHPDGSSIASYPCSGNVPQSPLGLFEDSRNRVWFGSYGNGYGQIDLSNGKCRYFPIRGVNTGNTNVYSFCEDKRGKVWAATMGNGLLRFDEEAQEMVVMSTREYLKWSCAIYYDKVSDCLFVGTYGSLEMVNLSLPKPFNSVKHLFSCSAVHGISPYGKHSIVVSADNGLYIYNIDTHEIKKCTTDNGTPIKFAYAAAESDDGVLWFSGTDGLTRLGNHTVQYAVQDGLQGNEFYKNAVLKAKDGTLYFGGQNGVTWFRPSEIKSSSRTCKVMVVGLKTGFNDYIIANDEGSYHLGSDIHSFSFEMVTSPLTMTRRVIYRCQMDDDGWQDLPMSQNQLSYSHMSPGHHTFEVCAIANGVKSEVTTVHIFIAYPWYRQWWAWLLWISMSGFLAFIVWKQYDSHRKEKLRVREAEMAEKAQEERLQFFINIAHDLRTPMTLIASPLQKLISTDNDSSRQHIYGMMQRNANRILSLVNQLMDVRRIDRGKMQLHCQKLDFSSLIRNIVSSVNDLATSNHQYLLMQQGTCTVQEAWVDPDFIEKILLNLLGNSVKYTPQGGQINVEWHTTDTHLSLSVADNGIGIPKEEKDYIFDRFYQGSGSKQRGKGTGIGLNLVNSLVTLHHGEIHVADGVNGKGTVFTVLLPLADSAYTDEEKDMLAHTESIEETAATNVEQNTQEEETVQENTTVPSPVNNRTTLLIVDDEADIRNFLFAELGDSYHIVLCENGRKALAILQREKVDLVLSDVMMPEMDGMELLREIRKNVNISHLPVIMLTAKNTDNDRIESLKLDVDAYIGKPFNLELLRSTIKSLLSRQLHLRNTFSGNQMPTEKIATPDLKSPDDRLLERVIKVVNENLSNPDITSEDIAVQVGLSRVHLYRKLLELTNQTASNYIRNIRLNKAAELLRLGKMSVAEIAYEVGFKTPNHFATAFKKVYGMSPSEYMKQDHSDNHADEEH